MNGNVYNIGDRRPPGTERPLSQTLSETVNQARIFVETRIAMLLSEMREKMANLKLAAPLIAVGGLFAVSAFLLLTGAIVAVLAVAFQGSAYAWFFALAMVGVVYAIVGGWALWTGKERISSKGIIPERTINVLKEDKVWLENEARTQL